VNAGAALLGLALDQAMRGRGYREFADDALRRRQDFERRRAASKHESSRLSSRPADDRTIADRRRIVTTALSDSNSVADPSTILPPISMTTVLNLEGLEEAMSP